MPEAIRTLPYFINGLRDGNRIVLGQAITLIESNLAADRLLASELITAILPATGRSIRIGISGVPGVGKSTFIEAFGKHLTSLGKKVAVLAVDPSSAKTKGSILGDKTRMETLSRDPLAMIRPSPAGAQLGGVARKTRETILLCEAAGYEVILIETVGVGQSETAVRDMTDFFLLLMLAGAGDELQGIKKGIIEMADAIVINKADGENLARVQKAQTDLQQALHYTTANEWGWYTRVLTCSALLKTGIAEVWDVMGDYLLKSQGDDFIASIRKQQNKKWMHECLDESIRQYWLSGIDAAQIASLESKVEKNELTAPEAARQLFDAITHLKKNQ